MEYDREYGVGPCVVSIKHLPFVPTHIVCSEVGRVLSSWKNARRMTDLEVDLNGWLRSKIHLVTIASHHKTGDDIRMIGKMHLA